VAHLYRVSNPCQHIGDWIGYWHIFNLDASAWRRLDNGALPFGLATYRLAFRTPGNSPDNAICLKQIRHRPKCLMYALGRPQRWQRLFLRTGNFGSRNHF